MTWPTHTVLDVQRLASEGCRHAEISRRTGVPVSTLRNWLYGRAPRGIQRQGARWCEACNSEEHDFSSLPSEYSYLLAVYLGDGNLCRQGGRSYSLRVGLDSAYPGIVDETSRAICAIRGRPPWTGRDRHKNLIRMVSYWKQWPCWIPQHGPGRKHSRPIVLERWQRRIVAANPELFLRGLIHTDGWRGLNRVHVKGRDYAYPRYQFSNRSDDIRRLFTDVCDLIGVEWRRWGRWHISVARRDSVAKLDEFIGPKR